MSINRILLTEIRPQKNLGKSSAIGLQQPEGGDFEALHWQPSTNCDRSTKLDLTTEPPLLASGLNIVRSVFVFHLVFQCRFCLALALEALLKALVERWLVRLLNVLTIALQSRTPIKLKARE
ncbi:hypothetical protein ACFOUP_06155 [Belliella kenyensis]|uniref:Uncharacterized protein n=1 Tax=Belliella kenyensis TaxID=1472724 RepID=A0ABV8EK96_9BACT|nr:hypothetical protein [Belliella kenyensis]MCH7401356.1 hypothetical protein [Belliella kenyensis]MDN3602799.1 hypothetical protein [Belliella kenyensis]